MNEVRTCTQHQITYLGICPKCEKSGIVKGMAKKIERSETFTQVIKGVERLSDAQLKERTRAYCPSAIERLVQLCNSKNEAIALGAVKVILAKNLPDLKAQELTGKDGESLNQVLVRFLNEDNNNRNTE